MGKPQLATWLPPTAVGLYHAPPPDLSRLFLRVGPNYIIFSWLFFLAGDKILSRDRLHP